MNHKKNYNNIPVTVTPTLEIFAQNYIRFMNIKTIGGIGKIIFERYTKKDFSRIYLSEHIYTSPNSS